MIYGKASTVASSPVINKAQVQAEISQLRAQLRVEEAENPVLLGGLLSLPCFFFHCSNISIYTRIYNFRINTEFSCLLGKTTNGSV